MMMGTIGRATILQDESVDTFTVIDIESGAFAEYLTMEAALSNDTDSEITSGVLSMDEDAIRDYAFEMGLTNLGVRDYDFSNWQ